MQEDMVRSKQIRLNVVFLAKLKQYEDTRVDTFIRTKQKVD